MQEGINRHGVRDVSGIGYIILLKDIDRDNYIETCYRTSTVSMVKQTGEYYRDIKVGKGLLNTIEFPEDEEKRGTPVVWVLDYVSGMPIVVATLQFGKEISGLQEWELLFSKTYEGNNISIGGNAKEGNFNLNVTAGGNGLLNIRSDDLINLFAKNLFLNSETTTLNNQSEIVLKVKKTGEDPTTTIVYKLGTGFNYKDEFDNEIEINKDHIKFKGKKFVLQTEQSSLKGLITDIVTEMSKITIQTAMGTQAPLNMAQIQEILTKKIGEVFE